MSKHEIIFPCGCEVVVLQVDNELPKVEVKPCSDHDPMRNRAVNPIIRDIINQWAVKP